MKETSYNNIILTLFLIFGTSFPNLLFAQAPAMHQYTVQDGLPSSNIYAALQTKDGFMWFGTDKGLVRFDGYRFEVFDLAEINGSNEVWDLQEDSEGRIWCATFNNLLYYQNNEFQVIPLPPTLQSNMVSHFDVYENEAPFVYLKNDNNLWQIHGKDTVWLDPIQFPEILRSSKKSFHFLKKDTDGTRWFCVNFPTGLIIFREKDNQFELFKELQTDFGFSILFTQMLPDSSLALFSRKAVYHFDFENFTPIFYKDFFEEDLKLLPNQRVNKEGLLFLNTDKGYRVLDQNVQKVEGFDFLNEMNINFFLEDRRGNIWICTSDEGLYFLPQKARNSQTYWFNEKPFNKKISSVEVDGMGNVWMGLSTGDLLKMDTNNIVSEINFQYTGRLGGRANKPIRFLKFDPQKRLHVVSQLGVITILPPAVLNQKDKTIQLWREAGSVMNSQPFLNLNTSLPLPFATVTGASPKDYKIIDSTTAFLATSNDAFEINFNDIGHSTNIIPKRTYAICQIADTIWLGRKEGLFFKDRRAGIDAPIQQDSTFKNSIMHLAATKENYLWVAVEGKGLYRYNGLRRDTIAELFDNKIAIYQILIDGEKNLYAATNKGIAKIVTHRQNPFQYQFKWFTRSDGLPNNEVTRILKKKNHIFAITAKGLTILTDDSEKRMLNEIPLFFTKIKINEENHYPENKFELPYNQNNIQIEFTNLNYEGLQNIAYEYKMEGIDMEGQEKWQTTTKPLKIYNTLAPNEYTFKLRVADLAGNWSNEKSIKIIIYQPWWQTFWAYFLYAIITLGLFYFFYKIQLSRKLAMQEASKIKELDEWKNRFFANISHEFRTPLTLLLGTSENLIEHPDLKKAEKIIRQNGLRLLNLVNQILDLTKLEQGEMKTHFVQTNVLILIRYFIEPFQHLAKAKNIDFQFQTELEELIMDIDEEKLQIVLFNLLSNAIKFTEKGGKIKLSANIPSRVLGMEYLTISISNTGTVIPLQDLPHIFDRFYQSNQKKHTEGTGIGLALCKELVTLMNGKIEVESELQKSTIFQVILPKTNNAKVTSLTKEKVSSQPPFPMDIIAVSHQMTSSPHPPEKKKSPDLPQLLIVEDNPDVQLYLNGILKNEYQLRFANNGKEGINWAIENIPDIILSDVLMPETDGFELCQTLKNDRRTSHIPIILLTVKADSDSKVAGLSCGADAYLTKPFEREELLIRLKKLWELRLKLQKRYSNNSAVLKEKSADELFKKEDQFLLELQQYILKNLDNQDLSIPEICKAVGMSRTQLHKKITALTGVSATKFIRKIRLEKAAKLLKTTNLSIKDVAHQTGLNPNRFSKFFKEYFGITPSGYRKNVSS